MEPTVSDCNGFNTLDDVMLWAGFNAKPASAEDPATARGALLAAIDMDSVEHWRVLGNISEDAYAKMLDTLLVNGKTLTMSERSKGELLGKACRIASGRDERSEVIRKRKTDELAVALLAPAVAALPTGPPAKKVKISTVADQGNDLEVPELNATVVAAAYAHFEALTGGQPATSEELTIDQLTSLHALLQGSGPPYVDFAVWGPFGHRISKKMKMVGLVMGPKGELHQTECFGPSTFSDWEQSFRVFRTGCMMLEAISSSALDQYHDLIQRYYQLYGPSVWLILYQADVRARMEHMERMRRQGAKLHSAGSGYTSTHKFDPARPWDWALRETIHDSSFWRKEMEEPAILVLAKAGRLSQMVDGDAPVAGSGSPAVAASMPARRHQEPAASAHKAKRGSRQHHVAGDGVMAANRRGVQLCGGFQSGACTELRLGRCAKDPNKSHQCAKCLQPGHGADSCNQSPANDPKRKMKGGGKGHSKGYGKGKQF
jgi:hypothetical protein